MATIWFLVQLFQGFKESLGTLMSSIFDKKVMVLRLKFYYWRCLAKQIAYSNCEVQNRYWRLLLFRKLTDRPKFFRFVRLLVQIRYNEVFLKSMKTTLKTWKTKVEVIIEFHKTMSDNSREKIRNGQLLTLNILSSRLERMPDEKMQEKKWLSNYTFSYIGGETLRMLIPLLKKVDFEGVSQYALDTPIQHLPIDVKTCERCNSNISEVRSPSRIQSRKLE